MPGRSIGLLFQGWSRGNPASIPNYTICRLGSNPRSRGVYCRAAADAMTKCGSSPLARGLQISAAPGFSFRGIIPARAGFTPGLPVHSLGGQDHPRSRGVYSPSGTRPSSCSGSSPLARGLQFLRQEGRGHERIIPARAGFTRIAPLPGRPLEDHPRSRGVYGTVGVHCGSFRGSSPLARGLQERF